MELKCTFVRSFMVLEGVHVTCSVEAICLCCLIYSYPGQMLSVLKFYLDRVSGYNKGNVSRNIQTDSSVTFLQISTKMMTLLLEILREADPDM